MLSDGNESRLVVGSSVDGCKPVCTSGETASNISREDTVLCRVVQALEERERAGGRGRGVSHGAECLNDDVRVALDVATATNLLRRGEVVLLSVDEEAGVEVGDRHLDGERLVLPDRGTVRWEDELR